MARLAGEVALLSSKRDFAKAEKYFDRALAVARQQQAKSWELRAAMSLARLWRDQGKVQQGLRATKSAAMLPQRSKSPLHQPDHPKSGRPTTQWNSNLALCVGETPGLCAVALSPVEGGDP